MNTISVKMPNLHKVRITDIFNLLLLVCLIMPDEFFGFITLYINRTPDGIAYKWLNYQFGIISAGILLMGIFLYSDQKRKEFGILVLMLIRELLFLMTGKKSCFLENSYEIYLSLILGICMMNIVCRVNLTHEDRKLFLWRAVFANITMVYISLLLHMNGIANRYNAPNMDVEATGVICGLAFIFCLFQKDVCFRYILACVACGGLVLSGSRINLLIALLVVTIGAFCTIVSGHKTEKNSLFNIALIGCGFAALLSIVLIAVYFLDVKISFGGSDIVDRMIKAMSFKSMESDSSVLGRSRSIGIGFKILMEHPCGISGFFTNLQLETQKYGFPTFPHSTVLTYYILIGPIVFILIIYMLKLFIRNLKLNKAGALGTLYLLLFFCLSGGPVVSFKPVFFYALFLYVVKTTEGEENILEV